MGFSSSTSPPLIHSTAAALQGAPVLTQDIDILYLLDEQNILHLKLALDELNAVARGDSRNLRFDETLLRKNGHKLASTDAGPLDILGAINDDKTYSELFPFTEELEVLGHKVRVLLLERLIELKRELGRPKDLALLPVLEATLRERNQSSPR